MFTWLQTKIQKHHKIVFGSILVVVIIAFVFTIGNFGGFGNPVNPNERPANFYGFNLNSQRDNSYLEQGTMISMQLSGQYITEDAFQRNKLARAVKLYLANELSIPGPNDEQFKEFLGTRPAFQDRRTGQFSQSQYTTFIDNMENNARISKETLSDTISQDFRIAKVDEALGGPGYVMPYQAVEVIKRRDTVWSIDVAELKREDFKPDIQVTDEALQAYYEENKARYETAPMISAEYILIPAEEVIDQVAEPTQTQLTAYYNQNRAKWPKDEEGKTTPLADIEDVVAAEWKQPEAAKIAVDQANKLADIELYNAVYSKDVKQTGDSLQNFLTQHGHQLQPLPPFSATEMPTDAPVPQKALRQALALDDQRFFTNGIATDDGAVIVFVRGMSETTIPPLDEVRERVVQEYKADEEQRQFNLVGQENQKKLQAAVDAGKSFTDEAQALGMTVDSFEDFKADQPPEGIDNFILQTIEGMDQGEVSNLVGFGDVGTIVYVKQRDIPEVDSGSEEVQQLISQLTSGAARATRMSIVNELIAVGDEKLQAEL